MDEYVLSLPAEEIDRRLNNIPTKVSQLVNDAGYMNESGVADLVDTMGYTTWDGAYAVAQTAITNSGLPAQIGDIESALDAIIAIQNELIGGGGE